MAEYAVGDSRSAASGEEAKYDECNRHHEHDGAGSKQIGLRGDRDLERLVTAMDRCRFLKRPIELLSTANAHSAEEESPVHEGDDSEEKPKHTKLQEPHV